MKRWTSPWFWLGVAVCAVLFVFYVPVARCPTCGGSGQGDDRLRLAAAGNGGSYDSPCKTCSGDGRLPPWLLGSGSEGETGRPEAVALLELTAGVKHESRVSAKANPFGPISQERDCRAGEHESCRAVIVVGFVLHNQGERDQSVTFQYALVDSGRFVRDEGCLGGAYPIYSLKPGHKKRIEERLAVPSSLELGSDWRLELFTEGRLVASCPIDTHRADDESVPADPAPDEEIRARRRPAQVNPLLKYRE